MKNPGKYLTTLLLFLVASNFSVLAQSTGTVSGVIIDSNSGEMLIGANILIKGTNRGAATGINGDFTINNVPPGRVVLVASYLSYRTLELEVDVEAGQTTSVRVELEWLGYTGEEVVISVQARGQISAINQQLSSNTIANIVSKDRIQEMPDVNAAESVGRLPGVSIQRSGGEANRIAIRGLSPKYNAITVNGVRLPSTGSADRSVDLSLISSNMLDGIEVRKALTPDMDADVLGGSVDLRLREAPDFAEYNIALQGGYNQLQSYAGNYKITASASNRFFNNRLGIIANVNLDEYDRSADKFSGSYERSSTVEGGIINVPTGIDLREELVKRGRTGASLLVDYRLPKGKIIANSFFNVQDWEGIFHNNVLNVKDNRHNFRFEERGGTTSILTGSMGVEQDYNWLDFDASVAYTASRADNPNEKSFFFTREGGSFTYEPGESITSETHPTEIPGFATGDMNRLGIQDIFRYDTERAENQYTAQLNVRVPFRLGNLVRGYFKTGGTLRWLDRFNDQQQYGRNGLYYGNSPNPNTTLVALDRAVPGWGVRDLHSQYGIMPLSFFQTVKTRSDFLDGDYPYGYGGNMYMLKLMMQALDEEGELLPFSIGSLGDDYDGIERYQAGYFMTELQIGQFLTLLPGVRYERDFSRYTGQRFREVTLNNIQAPPTDLEELTIERDNDFWLPMIHLNIDPVSWLKIRMAYTESLTRPDFIHYAPITRLNAQQNYARASNSLLKPAHSVNYDAAISVYESHIGLFTVAFFQKEISDLIFQINQPINPDFNEFLPPGLNLPDNWLTAPIAFGADTYVNNPFPATLTGFEIDWQTNFWYLPQPFQGLVLNINLTRIDSDMKKQLLNSVQSDRQKSGPPITPGPITFYRELQDTSRASRLPDQPANIANITVGYDYKGFSVRVSYLFQTDVVTYIDRQPELDNFSGEYARWDIGLQQNIGAGLQLFANFNNLNNRPDRNFRGGSTLNPTYIEYYGFTMDIGARYRF